MWRQRSTTLAALAGVDHVDHRAALAKLPPVDGLNMAPWLLGQTEHSPRTEVWNDLGVLIVGQFLLCSKAFLSFSK